MLIVKANKVYIIFFRRKSSRVIIRDALEVRLRMLIPYIGQWPQVY